MVNPRHRTEPAARRSTRGFPDRKSGSLRLNGMSRLANLRGRLDTATVAEAQTRLEPPRIRQERFPCHPFAERRPSFDSDALSTYFREVGAYRLLSRDEELALGRRIRAGDESAIGELVCANLRFVISIAKRYQNQGVSLSDLINEGNVGLLRAARKYDDAKGVKFISYAVWWIRQAIVQALSEICSYGAHSGRARGAAPSYHRRNKRSAS